MTVLDSGDTREEVAPTGPGFGGVGGTGDDGEVIGRSASPITIAEIQGTGWHSRYNGQWVENVHGVVTAFDAGTKKVPRSIYLQDPHAHDEVGRRSTAIRVVLNGKHPDYAPGTALFVRGVVREHESAPNDLTETRIVDPRITELATDAEVTPARLGFGKGEIRPPDVIYSGPLGGAVDAHETNLDPRSALGLNRTLESMLVEFDARVVGATNRGSFHVVVEGTHDVSEEGALMQRGDAAHPGVIEVRSSLLRGSMPEVTSGDRITGLRGIMSYRNQRPVLFPTEEFRVAPGFVRAETSTPLRDYDELRIATRNFHTISHRDRLACRHAADEVQALGYPDILIAQEVAADEPGNAKGTSTSAVLTCRRIAREIERLEGVAYDFVDFPPAPGSDGGKAGANIRTVVFFRPDRIQADRRGTPRTTTAPTLVEYDDGSWEIETVPCRIGADQDGFRGKRKPLVTEFGWPGAKLLVVGVHLPSPKGDGGPFGRIQPPQRPSEAKRARVLAAVEEFLENYIEANPAAEIVVAGDFNMSTRSDLNHVLDRLGFHDGSRAIPWGRGYTHKYKGQAFHYDNIRYRGPLLTQGFQRADVLHHNTPFPPQRVHTDHDPMWQDHKIPGFGTLHRALDAARRSGDAAAQATVNAARESFARGDNRAAAAHLMVASHRFSDDLCDQIATYASLAIGTTTDRGLALAR